MFISADTRVKALKHVKDNFMQIHQRVGIYTDDIDKLLEEGDYSRLNKKAGVWDGIYWAIITAIYFGWSFTTMRWEMTWIVWPIAGVVFAAYREVMKMIIKSKK